MRGQSARRVDERSWAIDDAEIKSPPQSFSHTPACNYESLEARRKPPAGVGFLKVREQTDATPTAVDEFLLVFSFVVIKATRRDGRASRV